MHCIQGLRLFLFDSLLVEALMALIKGLIVIF